MSTIYNQHGDAAIIEIAKSKVAHFTAGICKTGVPGGAKVKVTEPGTLEVRLARNEESDWELITIDVAHQYQDERIAEIKEGGGTTLSADKIRIGW